MKQKEAVFMAVCEVTGEHTFDSAVTLTAEQRKACNEFVTAKIESNECDFTDTARAKYGTSEKIAGYVSGLISNWLRKDKRLNGNIQYVAANPGSRAGQGDPQLKELRKLFKMHAGTPEADKIQAFIDARVLELKALKNKSIEVDSSLIPDELRNLV